jgi:hypothetical protein
MFTLFDFSSGASVNNFDVSDFSLGTLPPNSTPSNFQLAFVGNKLVVFATAIPEPSTWGGTVGLAAIMAAIVRWRRSAPPRRTLIREEETAGLT